MATDTGAGHPGMHRATGAALQGIEHLRQSIADILTTPLGTRLERRTYGSLLPELIDHPDNGVTRLRMMAATAGALMRWEPRLRVSRVQLASGPEAGQVTLELSGEYLGTGGDPLPLQLQQALQMRAAV